MAIKIKVRREGSNVKLLDFKCLEGKHLPSEYTFWSNKCVYRDGDDLFIWNGKESYLLRRGNLIDIKLFYEKLIPVVKEAGNNLRKINERRTTVIKI